MGACQELIFDHVGRAQFECVAARAQSAGLPINGDSGEAEEKGFTIRWDFSESTGTLRIQCLDSPILFPCTAINGKIASIVEGCRG